MTQSSVLITSHSLHYTHVQTDTKAMVHTYMYTERTADRQTDGCGGPLLPTNQITRTLRHAPQQRSGKEKYTVEKRAKTAACCSHAHTCVKAVCVLWMCCVQKTQAVSACVYVGKVGSAAAGREEVWAQCEERVEGADERQKRDALDHMVQLHTCTNTTKTDCTTVSRVGRPCVSRAGGCSHGASRNLSKNGDRTSAKGNALRLKHANTRDTHDRRVCMTWCH